LQFSPENAIRILAHISKSKRGRNENASKQLQKKHATPNDNYEQFKMKQPTWLHAA
jgi:hypothetical protein